VIIPRDRLPKASFSECFPSTLKRKVGIFSNPSGLKSVFEKLRFPDGLMWTVGLTVEIKRFQIPPAWCGWVLVGASGTRLLDPPSTQKSRFLMLTKRMAASGDKNEQHLVT